jgi:hypothetical protein
MSSVTLIQDVAQAGAVSNNVVGVGISQSSVEVQLGLRGVDGSAPPWGAILGDISNQTDLKAALDGKLGINDQIDGGNF